MSFGLLMDDSADIGQGDQDASFGRSVRRIASRRGYVFKGFGDDDDANLQPSSDVSNAVYDTQAASQTTTTTPVTSSTTTSTGTDAGGIAAAIAAAIGGVAKGAAQIVGVATGTGSCNLTPATPFYSPVTRMCYATALDAQNAGGGGAGLLVVGLLGVGVLMWLARGNDKGGNPAPIVIKAP